MVRLSLIFVLGCIIFSSCVPAKKIVFFQQDDLRNRKNIPKDSILRTHKMNIQEIRIQPLDILSISFESLTTADFDFFSRSLPDMRLGAAANSNLGGVLVDASGDIEYPVVGKIRLSGLTVFEAQDTLQQIALKYLRDVVVRVRLVNFRYTLLGEVNGEKTVISSSVRLTMAEAIAAAGGFSELADRANVKVIRQVGNESKVYYVNLLQEEFVESPYFYVQQNDVIIVPPLRQRTFKKYFVSNLGLITTGISAVIFLLTVSNAFN